MGALAARSSARLITGHADELSAALALPEDLDGDRFDRVSPTHNDQCHTDLLMYAQHSMPQLLSSFCPRPGRQAPLCAEFAKRQAVKTEPV